MHPRALLAAEGCVLASAYPPVPTSRTAAAPLMVYMKKETSLNLSKSEIGTGNILAVAANIVARFLTGCAALEIHFLSPIPHLPHQSLPNSF